VDQWEPDRFNAKMAQKEALKLSYGSSRSQPPFGS
jgi:hypothetical protein